MSEEIKNQKENVSIKPSRRRRGLNQRLKTLRERVNLLELELNNYTKDHFRVCIFGSARLKPEDEIYIQTEKIAYLLGKEGIDVLTGGGPGLMEAGNKGAREGKLHGNTNSKSFGITIELNQFEEEESEHLDIKHHHRKFSSRLDDFMRLSDAVIAVPGGIGTVLEVYFTWQLLQVGHITERPLILYKSDFWSGLIEWMKEIQLKKELISDGDFRWIHLADTPEDVLKIVKVEHTKFIERLEAQGRI